MPSITQIPVKLALYDYITTPRFESTQDGSTALENYNLALGNQKKTKLISIVSGIISGIIAFSIIGMAGFGVFLLFAIITVCAFVIPPKIANGKVSDAFAFLRNKIWEHQERIRHELIDKHLNKCRYYSFMNGEILIYDNAKIAYVATKPGELILYNKNNIKEVKMERVHLGSHTSGSAVSYTQGSSSVGLLDAVLGNPFSYRKHSGVTKTSIDSHTTEQYEWHFDVFCDFFEHPKISFIVPHDPTVEEEMKQVYAVIKP